MSMPSITICTEAVGERTISAPVTEFRVITEVGRDPAWSPSSG
jgi:hypothetical protein